MKDLIGAILLTIIAMAIAYTWYLEQTEGDC